MEALGQCPSGSVDLAIPIFKSAKVLRDKIKLVRYSLQLPQALRALIIILYPCSQVASEKAELMAAFTEYEMDITLLESLFNDRVELLGRHKLNTDLMVLAEYATHGLAPRSPAESDDDTESYGTSTNG